VSSLRDGLSGGAPENESNCLRQRTPRAARVSLGADKKRHSSAICHMTRKYGRPTAPRVVSLDRRSCSANAALSSLPAIPEIAR